MKFEAYYLGFILLIGCFILFGIGLFSYMWDMSESRDRVEECDRLPECEKYKCKVEESMSSLWKNTYSLEYQSCLMETSLMRDLGRVKK